MSSFLADDIDAAEEHEAALQKFGLKLSGKAVPPVPEEARAVWAQYACGRKFSRTMVGLRWYIVGEPLKASAANAALADPQSIVVASKRHDFRQFHGNTKSAISNFRRLAYTSSYELDRRVEEDPESFTNKELGVVATRAIAVVTDHERDQKEGSASFVEGLAAMSERFAHHGVRISIEISGPTPPTEEREVLDVGA